MMIMLLLMVLMLMTMCSISSPYCTYPNRNNYTAPDTIPLHDHMPPCRTDQPTSTSQTTTPTKMAWDLGLSRIYPEEHASANPQVHNRPIASTIMKQIYDPPSRFHVGLIPPPVLWYTYLGGWARLGLMKRGGMCNL